MSRYAVLTFRVPVEAMRTDDWRDDHRIDRLIVLADDMFPSYDVDFEGHLEPPSDQEDDR